MNSKERVVKTINFEQPDRSIFAKKVKKYYLVSIGNLFELLQWLFGYENLMVNLKNNPKIIQRFIDKEYVLFHYQLSFG